MHKSLDEFEFRPDPTTDYGVICPWALKNRRHHFFSVAIDPILFKLAGNEDMHNILDEFEFRQIGPPTTELPALERRKKIP